MNKIIVERSTVDIFDRATGNCFRFLLCRVEIFRWKKEKKKGGGNIRIEIYETLLLYVGYVVTYPGWTKR